MNSKTAEIVDESVNAAIVQLPSRAFPSMCVQGDALVSLASIAYENAQIWLSNEGDEKFPDDLLDSVIYLSNQLVAMALAYNEVMSRSSSHGQRLLNVDDLKLIDFYED
jgi:hypothetical protein